MTYAFRALFIEMTSFSYARGGLCVDAKGINDGLLRCYSVDPTRVIKFKDRAETLGFSTTMVTVEPGWHSVAIRDVETPK